MNIHNISWEKISNYYYRQMYIHERLAAEYKKQGLEYGGRTFYTAFDNKNIINDKTGTYVKGEYSGFIPSASGQLGVRGVYTKMQTNIHKKIIEEVCNEFYKATDKHLLDKFKEYDFKGISEEGFQKLITMSNELVFDIKRAKNWRKEVETIINKALVKQADAVKIKRPKYLLSMMELESIGRAILGRAVELCPIETGFLRDSGIIYVFGDYIRIIFECPYATYVHENVNVAHIFGQAKFLETAAQEILRDISIWTENTTDSFVYGTYMKQVWQKDAYGNSYGTPDWKEQAGYSAVYIDIDRNLKVNYVHYGTK